MQFKAMLFKGPLYRYVFIQLTFVKDFFRTSYRTRSEHMKMRMAWFRPTGICSL